MKNSKRRSNPVIFGSFLLAIISLFGLAGLLLAGCNNAGPMNNPVPSLSMSPLSPSSITAGGPSFTLTVTGSGFVTGSGSVVRWNGMDRPTTFVSGSQLTAAIPASDIATAGMAEVTVFNPPPGGGTSPSVTFVVLNPLPTLTSISPTSALVGGPGFTLTANGSGFISSSVVLFNEMARPTTFVSSTQLTASIPASDIAAGIGAQVRVFNPGPGGGESINALAFGIDQNPVPILTSIAPTSALAGGAGFTLTANGSGFISSSAVLFNEMTRPTTFVSSTQLTASIPASDIAAGVGAQVRVFNPGPGGGESINALAFGIDQPVPSIGSLAPSSATAGGAGFTLTVNGSGFTSVSVVQWNGANRTTTFVSSTQLSASITAADVMTAGTANVTVVNPAPGGGTSNIAVFNINNPVPMITMLTPSTATEGDPDFTLTVDGSGFVSASLVQWNGMDRPTTFVSSTQLTASITAADIAVAGMANVTVVNPTPGGGTSNTATFTINTAAAAPGVIERVSVNTDGTQANGISAQPSTSGDGRFVAFTSLATNLLGSDNNNAQDVFLRDTCSGAAGCTPTTILVSMASNGTQGNDSSFNGLVSADGGNVTFGSVANNLVAGDTNSTSDAFVRNIVSNTAVRVSLASDGSQANGSSGADSASPDGRFIAFTSTATNLVGGDANATLADVFVRDTISNTTVMASVATTPPGTQSNSNSALAAISADGRFVAFESQANNLVADDNNFRKDIFLRDTISNTTVRVSVSSDGSEANGDSFGPLSISANGRFVAFGSVASNLVAGDNNGRGDLFVHDTLTSTTGRVSVASDGSEANNESNIPSMSASGRFVAFQSPATNLITGDTNGAPDIFVRDTCFGTPGGCTPSTVRVSVASDGSEAIGFFGSSQPAISADGRFVVFASFATNLVVGDTNGTQDIFVARTGF